MSSFKLIDISKDPAISRLISRIYFFCIIWLFALINIFKRKTVISRPRNEILLQSATELSKKIRRKEVTSEEVVEAFIARCREINPTVNAIVQDDFENALNEARHIDYLISTHTEPSPDEAPFLGVPFTMKDRVFVKGLICTAGIPNRKNKISFEDAEVVQNMKNAGAIVLAVTNVSEALTWWESNNTIYGRTNNPYDSRRTVGGSSGGEGALISSAGSVFGIGSDTGGSIRTPSFFNGIFGHKPTGNVVSSQGLYPPASDYKKAMGTAGPMCRYAEDLLPMLKVLAGPVGAAKLTLDKQVDFTKLKIFYMEDIQSSQISPVNEEMKKALHQVIKHFEEKYNVLSYKLDLTNFHRSLPIWMNDTHSPNAPTFAQKMTDFQGEVNPYSELYRWLVGKSDHTFPAIGFALIEKLKQNGSVGDGRRALKHLREQLCLQFETLLSDNAIFLFPPHPTLTPFHNQPIWTPHNFMYAGVFNALLLPVTCCPMGLSSNGTPLGVQVVGASNCDHITIAVANELESAFGGWTPAQC